MRVFLYEFVTGGGFTELHAAPVPDSSLLREGRAMWSAVYHDLVRIPGVHVASTWDARLPEIKPPGCSSELTLITNRPRATFLRLARESDATLVIAPEFDRLLYQHVLQLEAERIRTIGLGSRFIAIAGNKTATHRQLTIGKVPSPDGQLLSRSQFRAGVPTLPAVLKHNDGAGSMCQIIESLDATWPKNVMRVEQLVAGLACSVSFFCQGVAPPIACPPMKQILSCEGSFQYLGGQRMMDPQLINRAQTLGRRVIAAMPPTTGYVGVDLLLGSSTDGQQDVVIEINPRLTTSYIGLRAIAKSNLAEAMLDIALGKDPTVEFSDHPVEFLSDGTVQ